MRFLTEINTVSCIFLIILIFKVHLHLITDFKKFNLLNLNNLYSKLGFSSKRCVYSLAINKLIIFLLLVFYIVVRHPSLWCLSIVSSYNIIIVLFLLYIFILYVSYA